MLTAADAKHNVNIDTIKGEACIYIYEEFRCKSSGIRLTHAQTHTHTHTHTHSLDLK